MRTLISWGEICLFPTEQNPDEVFSSILQAKPSTSVFDRTDKCMVIVGYTLIISY